VWASNPKFGGTDSNDLPFETAVAFVVLVMFANSRNVSFEKAEAGKPVSGLSYAVPTMLNTNI
jgi:hypothetical protein